MQMVKRESTVKAFRYGHVRDYRSQERFRMWVEVVMTNASLVFEASTETLDMELNKNSPSGRENNVKSMVTS